MFEAINEKYGEYSYCSNTPTRSLPSFNWFTDYGLLNLEGNDTDGNGVIDESDCEEEWKNYSDEKLN